MLQKRCQKMLVVLIAVSQVFFGAAFAGPIITTSDYVEPDMHLYAATGNIEKFKEKLAEKPHDINRIDYYYGAAPLNIAVYFERWEIAKILLEKGAESGSRLGHQTKAEEVYEGKKHTILYTVIAKGRLDIAKMMIEKSVNSINAISPADMIHVFNLLTRPVKSSAVRAQYADLTRSLINNARIFKAADGIGLQAKNLILQMTVRRGQLEQARLMIDHGAAVNYKKGSFKVPLLHTAVGNVDFEMAKMLIEKGADINAANVKGETALDSVYNQRSFLTPSKKLANVKLAAMLVEKGGQAEAAVHDRVGWGFKVSTAIAAKCSYVFSNSSAK